MSVQTLVAGRRLSIDTDDFQRVDRNVRWAIKFINYPGMAQTVSVVIVNQSGELEVAYQIDDTFDLDVGPNSQSRTYMTILEWFHGKFIPSLNRWLAQTFGAVTPGTTPVVSVPVEIALLQEAFNSVSRNLMIITNPDGTLTASYRDSSI